MRSALPRPERSNGHRPVMHPLGGARPNSPAARAQAARDQAVMATDAPSQAAVRSLIEAR